MKKLTIGLGLLICLPVYVYADMEPSVNNPNPAGNNIQIPKPSDDGGNQGSANVPGPDSEQDKSAPEYDTDPEGDSGTAPAAQS